MKIPRDISKLGRPAKPVEITGIMRTTIPRFIFDAFNGCIARAMYKGSAIVKQRDVIAEIMRIGSVMQPQIIKNEILDYHWLDVEDLYRAAGWKVVYDGTGRFNRDDEPTFIFSIKKN